MDTVPSTDLQTRRRRWFGSLCLLGAIGMLVLGEVLLKGRLRPAVFLLYWLGCFLLTILAIFTALIDLRALRLKSASEQRKLITETIREIERDQQAKHGGGPETGSHP